MSQEGKLKPLGFVREGDVDIELQRLLEKRENSKLDSDIRNKERLTLQEQLRLNAITKQEEFNSLVKDRNSFNRLSKEDIEFYESLRTKAEMQNRGLQEYLDKNSQDFEELKLRSSSKTIPAQEGRKLTIPSKVVKRNTASKSGLKGIVKKKKSKKTEEGANRRV